MTRLRIAVLGGGHLGRIHARLLATHPGVELVGVVDPSADARSKIASELQLPTYRHHSEIPTRLEAAVLATNTPFHASLGCELLSEGVHLLVEKPLTTTVALADEMIRLAAQRGLVLQVGHVERFNPAWQAARRYIHRPRFIEAVRTSGYTFRSTDIGVVHDLMIHDLDLVLSVAASAVVEVEAVGTTVFGPFEDMAHVRLRFANGCVATLTASRTSMQSQRSMQIITRRGYVGLDFSAPAARVVLPDKRLLRRQLNVHEFSAEQKDSLRTNLFSELLPKVELPIVATNAIQDEQREFVECILNERTPTVSGEHARECLAIAEQILLRMKQPSMPKSQRDVQRRQPQVTTALEWRHRKAG